MFVTRSDCHGSVHRLMNQKLRSGGIISTIHRFQSVCTPFGKICRGCVCEVSCVGGCDLQAELLYFHLCVGKANADLKWEELASVK